MWAVVVGVSAAAGNECVACCPAGSRRPRRAAIAVRSRPRFDRHWSCSRRRPDLPAWLPLGGRSRSCWSRGQAATSACTRSGSTCIPATRGRSGLRRFSPIPRPSLLGRESRRWRRVSLDCPCDNSPQNARNVATHGRRHVGRLLFDAPCDQWQRPVRFRWHGVIRSR